MGWGRNGIVCRIVLLGAIRGVIEDVTPVTSIIIFILGTLRKYKKCRNFNLLLD